MRHLAALIPVFAAFALSGCGGGTGGGSGGSSTAPPLSEDPVTLTSPMTPGTMTGGGDPIPISAASADNVAFQSMLTSLRLDNGAGSIAYDGRLAVAAQVHANDMLANDIFSHTGSDGSSVGDRATAAGYNWRAIGENVAQGFPDESSVLAGWIASPSHQANNINPVFEDFALAQAGDGSARRWVLVLGAEQ